MQMPMKDKVADTGNWSLYPQINSFIAMRWELNRNGRIVVFAKDAPITCTGFSAVKQVASFVVPVMGDDDAKVRRAVIHVVIYFL